MATIPRLLPLSLISGSVSGLPMQHDSDHPAPLISYVVTVYNKAPYLPLVVRALAEDARQLGTGSAEFVFVDDGSGDGSADIVAAHAGRLPGRARVLRQANAGASAATNNGVLRASGTWIRLVDGDDMVAPGSTAALRNAAHTHQVSFAFGATEKTDLECVLSGPVPVYGLGESRESNAWMARFMRNCSGNSTCMLMRRDRFLSAGGCDEHLRSPDYMLFLRLLAAGPAAALAEPVAYLPPEASGRLSDQVLRSRYDAATAIYNLLCERPDLDRALARYAVRRCCSRALNYYRQFGSGPQIMQHWRRYLLSKVWMPRDTLATITATLTAYTRSASTRRPRDWMTGAELTGTARYRVDANSVMPTTEERLAG